MFLTVYGQLLLGFILGVATSILGQVLFEWYRRQKNRPRLLLIPMATPTGNHLSIAIAAQTKTNSPLLKAANTVDILFPKVIIDGELKELTRPEFIVDDVNWRRASSMSKEVFDIYPFPPALLELGSLIRWGPAFRLSFLGRHEAEFFGNATNLTFSTSSTMPSPTTDFRIGYLIIIHGESVTGEYFSRRVLYVLTLPAFCTPGFELAKATLLEVPTKEGDDLHDSLKSFGFDVDTQYELAPLFPDTPPPGA